MTKNAPILTYRDKKLSKKKKNKTSDDYIFKKPEKVLRSSIAKEKARERDCEKDKVEKEVSTSEDSTTESESANSSMSEERMSEGHRGGHRGHGRGWGLGRTLSMDRVLGDSWHSQREDYKRSAEWHGQGRAGKFRGGDRRARWDDWRGGQDGPPYNRWGNYRSWQEGSQPESPGIVPLMDLPGDFNNPSFHANTFQGNYEPLANPNINLFGNRKRSEALGMESSGGKSTQCKEEDLSPQRKDTLNMSLKASKIIDDILKKTKSTTTKTTAKDTDKDKPKAEDRGAQLLSRAEKLCADIREKRELAKISKEQQEKKKKEEQQDALDKEINTLTDRAMSKIRGYVSEDGLNSSRDSFSASMLSFRDSSRRDSSFKDCSMRESSFKDSAFRDSTSRDHMRRDQMVRDYGVRDPRRRTDYRSPDSTFWEPGFQDQNPYWSRHSGYRDNSMSGFGWDDGSVRNFYNVGTESNRWGEGYNQNGGRHTYEEPTRDFSRDDHTFDFRDGQFDSKPKGRVQSMCSTDNGDKPSVLADMGRNASVPANVQKALSKHSTRQQSSINIVKALKSKLCKSSSDALTKDNLMRLVNAPRSHKERMMVSKMLKTHRLQQRLSTRHKLNLQSASEEAKEAVDFEEDQAINLDDLPEDVRDQIAALINEEMGLQEGEDSDKGVMDISELSFSTELNEDILSISMDTDGIYQHPKEASTPADSLHTSLQADSAIIPIEDSDFVAYIDHKSPPPIRQDQPLINLTAHEVIDLDFDLDDPDVTLVSESREMEMSSAESGTKRRRNTSAENVVVNRYKSPLHQTMLVF